MATFQIFYMIIVCFQSFALALANIILCFLLMCKEDA